MSAIDFGKRQQAMRRTLAQLGANAPDADAVARAMLGAWQQMDVLLQPVIGARGIHALLGRALHLTAKSFPWLASQGGQGDGAASLQHVADLLRGREVTVAAHAGAMLLVTFHELLAGLIGESLTERLLGAIWQRSDPASEKEIAK